MSNSILSLEEIHWIWLIYYISAMGLWLLLAWALNYKKFLWWSVSLLALCSGLLFTPWFIVDSKSDMAPAFMILLFDLFRKTDEPVIRSLIPVGLVVLVTFFALMCWVGIRRWQRVS